MNFTPLTDEQINAQRGTIEPGECDFEIVKSEEKVSSKGNPMIEVQMRVWDRNGREGYVFDYILATPEFAWKLKSLCEAIGKADLYESGSIDQGDLLGKAGKVMIKIKDDKQYGPKPVVKYYIEAKAKPVKENELPDFNENEDIPF